MTTLEDIFNDDFFLEIEEKKDKEIKASGWTREEIESMANFIIKNKNIRNIQKRNTTGRG